VPVCLWLRGHSVRAAMRAWVKRFWVWLSGLTATRRQKGGARAAAGRRGERLAREHLAGLGYRILAANWRSPADRRDEIDLVAADGVVLVFVEVKTRAAGALVAGRYAVDARKKRALRRAVYAYLNGLERTPRSVRFDVVEVSLPARDLREAAPNAPELSPKDPAAGSSPRAGTSEPAAAAVAEPVVRHFKNLPLFPKTFRRRGS